MGVNRVSGRGDDELALLLGGIDDLGVVRRITLRCLRLRGAAEGQYGCGENGGYDVTHGSSLVVFSAPAPAAAVRRDATPGLRHAPRPTRAKALASGISAGNTPAVEEGLLFRCGRAAEDLIAMGKPSEPPNDIGV